MLIVFIFWTYGRSKTIGIFVHFFPPRLLLGGKLIPLSQSIRMEKVIVRACAGILVGVVIIFVALWRVADYTWDK
jgi:hypothetical protein